MEFDKNKVYTALNAGELQIGSKCIFADTLMDLRQGVQSEDMDCFVLELTEIRGDGDSERFTVGDTNYLLAYLIEPPKEPQYKPFSSAEKAKEIIDKHGGWVKEKTNGNLKLITSINGSDKIYSIGTGGTYCNPQFFLECCVFADDGSPCGELAE